MVDNQVLDRAVEAAGENYWQSFPSTAEAW